MARDVTVFFLPPPSALFLFMSLPLSSICLSIFVSAASSSSCQAACFVYDSTLFHIEFIWIVLDQNPSRFFVTVFRFSCDRYVRQLFECEEAIALAGEVVPAGSSILVSEAFGRGHLATIFCNALSLSLSLSLCFSRAIFSISDENDRWRPLRISAVPSDLPMCR